MHRKLFCLALLLLIVLFSPLALAKWWDNDYNASKQITIIAGTTIDTNMTVDLNNLNTTSTASYLATCNDLRIVFQDTNEVQRAVTGCRSTNTKVYFKPLAAINSGSSNTDYKIYFDNPSATAPTIDMNTVALWGDRFEGASESGSWITGGTDHHSDINSQEHIEGTSSLTMRTTGTSTLRYNFGAINQGNVDLITHYLDQPSDVEGITFFPQIASTTGVMQDFRLGVQTDINTIGYVVFDGTGWRQISKPRTLAWHTVRIEYFDTNSHCAAYFDDTNVMGCGESNPTTRVLFDVEKTGTSDLNGYFDLFMVRKHVDNKPNLSMGADLNFGVDANISRTPGSPYYLDTENGITSVTIDFNDTSTYHNTKRYLTAWLVNDVNVSADQNLHYSFTTAGDYNISLIVDANAGANRYRDQQDYNLSIFNSPQGLDITFIYSTTAGTLDVNYTATNTVVANYYVWGFPNDQNLTGTTVSKTYREGDKRNVCVIANATGDINKLHCESFYSTRVISKIPINISTLGNATPFSATVNIVPSQSYSSVSVDQNFWFFYTGTPDTNTYNLTVDANVGYFISTYLIGLGASDFNKTIQPYVVPVTDGINVVITGLDFLTNDIVPNTVLFFSRNISGVGNVLINSGITDSTGRIAFPFIANIDHNYTLQYPFGTTIKTGNYIPQSGDTLEAFVPSTSTVSTTVTGVADVNFVQNQATPKANGSVDLNEVITTTRTISSIRIAIDHNGTTLFNDLNSTGVSTGGRFGQNIDVNNRSSLYPLDINVTITFTDGNATIFYHSVSIARTDGLFENFVNAKSDLGDTAGTMILSVIVIAIILGAIHWGYPEIDQSYTFVLGATILAFLSFVGWIDGVSWVFATIAAGATYFMRRVER